MAAQLELDSITGFQRQLNMATDSTTPIYSTFSDSFTKGMWHSSHIEELQRRDDNDDECTYSINGGRDVLIYITATWKAPNIRVKEQHKDDTLICWTKNLATNRFEKGKFYSADTLIQEIDSVWMDIYFQAFMENKEGARESHNLSVGNIPELTDFSTELPETPLNFDLPWYYSEHPALAYPLYQLHRNKARSYHTFTLKNKIWDLLRMCVKDEKGEWITVNPSDHPYCERLEYGNEKIAYPKIWGRYATLTAEEKECHASESKSYIIRNVMSVNTDNSFKLGTTQTLKLSSIAAPCLAIFWVAENKEATQNNCYSNYTTHHSVPERRYARNPVETSTLRYTKDPKGASGVGAACFEEFPSEHFTDVSFRHHLPSRPTEIGYHCYSFAQNLGGYLHGERAVSLAAVGAEFSCKFWRPRIRGSQRRPVDPQRDLEASISDSVSVSGSTSSDPADLQRVEQLLKTEYILHTRLLIVRELSFEHLSDKTVVRLI